MKLPQRTRDYLTHGAPKGQRNAELFDAACQMRDARYGKTEADALLVPRAVSDGLSGAEINKTIESAYEREPRESIGAAGNAVHGTNGAAFEGYAYREAQASREQQADSLSREKKKANPLPDPIPEGLKVLLETCFNQGERVGISDTKSNAAGERKPGPGDVFTRECWLEKIAQKPLGDIYPDEEGLFIRINPLRARGKTDADVTALRHVLAEFDLDSKGNRIPKEVQYKALLDSGMPISVILDSGDKSIHGWICVDAPNRQEYDRRRELIWDHFKAWGLDPQNKNPSRYSRCPSVYRNLHNPAGEIVGVGRQALLAIKVGAASWEEWEKAKAEPDYTDEELRELESIRLERYHVNDRPFPRPMNEAAFSGIAGEIVDIIEPISEASREGILAQLLVALGNLIGRAPLRKQAGLHHLNEFAVLIGETAKGRKGTAWEAVQNLLTTIAQDWLSTRMRDGFQSGEAIIHAVRDEIVGPIPMHKRKAGEAHKVQTAVLDPGVTDKRLLIFEEEFARLLIVAARLGNTLFSILRKSWDGKKWLYTEGKISPEKATDAHISMIGHITLMELLECLREVENKNGFSNRVLWLAVRRVKKIALPGWVDWEKYSDITTRLTKIVETFKAVPKREMSWSPEGQTQWRNFYDSVTVSNSGILGAIMARADAHVLRLTMTYCVLDHSTLMEPKHLQAAIAFWQYCERSAQWAFGEKTGNKAADKIYWALQREPKGMTRTEISEEVFARNCPKTTIDAALASLVDANLACFQLERTQKTKNPPERWFAKNSGLL